MRLAVVGGSECRALIEQLAKAAGVDVDGRFGTPEAMHAALVAGAACDVAVLDHDRVTTMTASGLVEGAVIADLGRIRTPAGAATVYSAAVNAAASHPDAARAFVNHLGSREAAALRATLGFEGAAIRRATRAEEAAIRELVFGILDEYAIVADPGHTDRDLFDLDAAYYARGGMFDVAIDPSGQVVGCCGTMPTGESTCELRKMYVRRDQRGQGLGQRLLDRALAFARGRGCRRMTLETASVLKEAMAMYEKAGFVRQDHPPEVKRCDRVYALELG